MFAFFANIFGYLLNFIYELVNNYGLAIIIFSIIIKVVFLPMSIKQQKTMKKTAKIQEEMKELQNKYKNNPEKLNQETIALYQREKMKELQIKYKNNPEMLNKETMALYKSENASPFGGCFSSIIQIILLLSVFFLVQSPLTYMRKVDTAVIDDYKTKLEQSGEDTGALNYPEITIIKENGQEDERVYINMDFLGLDLSSVPVSDLTDYRVLIIPALYVISSVISMRISTNVSQKKKKEDGDNSENNEMDAIEQANKNMMYIMPVMSVSIALIAPLGLALYWLVNNLLMIVEKLVMNKFMKTEGEEDA